MNLIASYLLKNIRKYEDHQFFNRWRVCIVYSSSESVIEGDLNIMPE